MNATQQTSRWMIVFLSITLITSCGEKRARKSLSRGSPALQFTNGATADQAAVNPQNQYALQPLLGTYGGTLSQNGYRMNYTFELSTEEVRITEDDRDYTFAKLKLTTQSGAQVESYLAVQNGSVSGVPALAFSSTVLTNAQLSPSSSFAIYLVLATNAGQFLPTQSAIYLLDCGFSQGGSCPGNKLVSTTQFGTDLSKRL